MYSTIKVLDQSKKNDLGSLFFGELFLHPCNDASNRLVAHAKEVAHKAFGGIPCLNGNSETELKEFIEKAEKAKSSFTNSSIIKEILEELILTRYEASVKNLFYDVPRLRIIPNSSMLKSGISYNYLPHRDTWYGSGQEQINHWLSVSNVTKESTFYIAPKYFLQAVPNNSEVFDLDIWDSSHRKAANSSIRTENRPHPTPTQVIPNDEKLAVVIPPGYEICFSGHHLHGSLPNVTTEVRLSVDYRVSIPSLLRQAPTNIDCRAKGDYLKFMVKHPGF